MTDSWRAATAALDAGAALCATINAAYFAVRLANAGGEPPGRQVAIGALLLICLGALLEALVLLAASQGGDGAPLLSSSQWFVVRLVVCAGGGGVCALVLRRISGGGG